eukprot:780513_1
MHILSYTYAMGGTLIFSLPISIAITDMDMDTDTRTWTWPDITADADSNADSDCRFNLTFQSRSRSRSRVQIAIISYSPPHSVLYWNWSDFPIAMPCHLFMIHTYLLYCIHTKTHTHHIYTAASSFIFN